MRILFPVVALSGLAGCILGSGAASRVEKVPEEFRRSRLVAPEAPDRHPYGDVTRLRPGQWATYRLGGRLLTLAASALEGDSMWIEVVEEGEPRQVSARLVGPDGVVRKAYYGEVSKDGRASAVEAQALEQTVRPPPGLAGGTRTGEETVRIGGRELKCVRFRSVTEDLEGRRTEDVQLWSPDVPPIYAGAEGMGLVRRREGTEQVELQAFGADARALLVLPR